MDSVLMFTDIQKMYKEFLKNTHYPKLENLNNWGKNRYFFSQYFKVVYDQYKNEKIIIIFNQRQYCLDTKHAPDFMDQENYIQWLSHHLLQ